MDLSQLIKQWAKKTKLSEIYIQNLVESCKLDLIKQGLNETEDKFYPYLIMKVKKKLKIETNTIILKTFKNFLKEN